MTYRDRDAPSPTNENGSQRRIFVNHSETMVERRRHPPKVDMSIDERSETVPENFRSDVIFLADVT